MSKLLGIIGGSGVYKMGGVKIEKEEAVDTPFGKPSDVIMTGKFEGADVAFLPRHGRGHKIPPNEINYRANIFALKLLGVDRIISLSAVGSMKENIKPGHIVIVDQFVDRTKSRPDTFFGNGIAVHASFADPVCPVLKAAAAKAALDAGVYAHNGGSYLCIEGPMFSSRAESKIYRLWGVDVIGMTNYQEARLAREAEICFTTLALATDYDCWHEGEVDADVAMVVKTMKENVERAERTLRLMIPAIGGGEECKCHSALKGAIMTDPKTVSEDVKKRLGLLLKKYL